MIIPDEHNFSTWVISGETATRSCTDCGYVDSCEHTFGSWTENADGTYTRTCTHCGGAENCLFGDLNDDKIVDSFDLILLRKILVNEYNDSHAFLAADVDQDNSITVIDLKMLNDYLLGRISKF